ncbi:hypothetical protein [Sphingobium agri]|uniref:Excisionase n=1 Tax=Sphingobium agri TaxID=2933566 RepID=A0ABT0DWP4_9SPHN|nr:hypothetical protein [Sphingobium agri]MCK0531484.1 hypothetical protein [Sphingobium agri]
MGLALEKLPDWPAAMNREWALAYTGVSGEQMKEWVRSGKVRFRPRGPKGAMVALKADLDAALADLFGSTARGAPEF